MHFASSAKVDERDDQSTSATPAPPGQIPREPDQGGGTVNPQPSS